ncbi:cell surface protein [Methanosarcina hadiensis]|uniref:cell surface protein n=1 Tax=Methanosarcina hadiensis TaxID=3078083 RepID=UPI003977BEAF
MKWIKKLFGKQESSHENNISSEISFDELPAWLDRSSQKIFSEIENDASGLFKELGAAISELKESNKRLLEAKVEGNFDIRAVKRAKSNRENVTKQVGVFIDKLGIPENKDFKALKGFYETAMQNLNTCLEHMNRSFRYTRPVFPEESKDVTDSLGRIGHILNQLRETIRSHSREMESIEAASKNIAELRELSVLIKTETMELESKNQKLQALKDEAARTGKALEEFKHGEAWQKLQSLQEELTLAGERFKKAETGLSSLILPLSGNFSRIKKLHESGKYTLKPEVKKQLDISLEDPASLNPSFLPELQKVFEDPALDIQAQKKEKALTQVRVAALGFEEKKKEYIEARNAFEAKKSELANSDTGELVGLERKETELLARVNLLQEEIESSEKKLTVLKENLKSREEKLQESIAAIDNGVKIQHSQ